MEEINIKQIEDDDLFKVGKYLPKEIYIPISNGIIRNNQITSLQLKIYELLYSYRACDNIIIKQSTIAEQLNIARKSCNTNIQNLVKLGFLEKEEKITNKGKRNIYTLIPYEEWCLKKNVKIVGGVVLLQKLILISPKLTNNELRIYQILKSFGGMVDGIKPSLQQIEKYSGISKPTIVSSISNLENKGLIQVLHNQDVYKGKSENQYIINNENEWLEKKIKR